MLSTESGIPDFRSQGGLWKTGKNFEYYISRDYYRKDPEDFWRKFKEIFKIKIMGQFKPNRVHDFLKYLEEIGKEVVIATQNIDGLHHKAGSSKVYEMHGTLRKVICRSCGAEYGIEKLLEEDVPRCNKQLDNTYTCNTILDTDVVLFGDRVRYFNHVVSELDDADVFLAMGTSLEVYLVNTLVDYAKYNENCRCILVNREPTKKDYKFHYVIHGELGEVVKRWKEGDK